MNVTLKKITMIVMMIFGFFPLPSFAQISETTQPPSQKEIARKILAGEIETLRDALFDDPENGQKHVDIARKYLAQGSLDIAENEFKRALQLGTPLREIMVELGNVYIKRAKYEQIIESFSIEEALTEDRGEIFLLLGLAYYEMGNFEPSFENLLAAKSLLDERFDLVAPLAQIYNLYGDYEKAEINVDKALEFNAMNVDMLLLKGDLRHRAGGSKYSYRYYERAAFYQPNNITALVKVAGALYNLKLDKQAFKYLNRVLKLDKSNILANFMAAAISARRNEKNTAISYLNEAGQGLDEFGPGLLLKGKLNYDARSFDVAETCLNQLISIDENNIEARRLLASSLLFQNKTAAALRILNYLNDHNMAENIDYMLLASAYLQDKNYDKASQYFKRISSRDLDHKSQNQRISLAEFKEGKEFGVTLGIDAIFNENIALNQQQVFRIYVALNEKKYDLAFEMSAQLVEDNRRNPLGYNLLGLSYQGLRKFDAALSNYRKAISLDRNFYNARINIARLEYDLGRKNSAITAINEILKTDENYLPAYETLFGFARMDGDEIRAEIYLISAANLAPGSIEIRQKLLNFYFNINNLAKAGNLAATMMDDFPDHYLSYKSLARVNLTTGNFSSAIRNLEQSLSMKQDDEEIYLLLSDAYIGDNQTALVRPMLHKGLLYVRDTMPLMKKLIYLAATDGDFNDSYRYIDQLKLNESTRSLAFFYQGDLNLLENKPVQAIKSFENAYKSGGSESKASINIAKARELLNNLQ